MTFEPGKFPFHLPTTRAKGKVQQQKTSRELPVTTLNALHTRDTADIRRLLKRRLDGGGLHALV